MKTRSASGFTLVEYMVVMALIIFIAMLSLGTTSFLHTMIVQAELDHLHSVMRYMQHKAQATHAERVITFDPIQHHYTFDSHTHSLAPQARFAVRAEIKGPPASPSHALTSAITFPHYKLICYPTGIMSSGTVYVINKDQKKLYALSNAVGSVSYPRKYRYANKKWHLITS